VRSYGWVQEYDPRSYGELLRTHSDHRLLDPRRLDKLVEAVENAIERLGGRIVYPYRTDLQLLRRRRS